MIRILGKTESTCSVCNKKIDAVITEENGDMYMMKKCEEHGVWKDQLQKDTELYKKWDEFRTSGDLKVENMKSGKGSGCSSNCKQCSGC